MTVATPGFYQKNAISDVSEIVDSGATTNENKFKIFDRNHDTIYSGGSQTGTITITFLNPTIISNIFILNMNWASGSITYKATAGGGDANFSPDAISFATYTNVNRGYSFSTVSVYSITITISSTHVGDNFKCSQIIITKGLGGINADNAGKFIYTPMVSQRLNQLSDGTYDKTFIKSNFGYKIETSLMSSTDVSNLRTVFNYNRSNSLFFIPELYILTETNLWNGICGHVHWINALDVYNATLDFTVNGYNGFIELYPAGGIG